MARHASAVMKPYSKHPWGLAGSKRWIALFINAVRDILMCLLSMTCLYLSRIFDAWVESLILIVIYFEIERLILRTNMWSSSRTFYICHMPLTSTTTPLINNSNQTNSTAQQHAIHGPPISLPTKYCKRRLHINTCILRISHMLFCGHVHTWTRTNVQTKKRITSQNNICKQTEKYPFVWYVKRCV